MPSFDELFHFKETLSELSASSITEIVETLLGLLPIESSTYRKRVSVGEVCESTHFAFLESFRTTAL